MESFIAFPRQIYVHFLKMIVHTGFKIRPGVRNMLWSVHGVMDIIINIIGGIIPSLFLWDTG